MRRALYLLALCACDRAFGLETQVPSDVASDVVVTPDAPVVDLDGDGIPDDIDPCIVPKSDDHADIDGDGVQDVADSCPLLVTPPNAPDSDNDGLLDPCDPDPQLPDHVRCVMAFTDPTVTDRLWRPDQPAPTLDFTHPTGALHCNANTSCATVVAEPAGAPSGVTIYEVRFTTGPRPAPGSIAVWPRLTDGTRSSDVACVFSADGTGAHLTILNSVPLVTRSVADPGLPTLFIRTSISTGDPATVTCNVTDNGVYSVADLLTTIPTGPGALGLSTAMWLTDAVGIAIITH